MAVAFRGGRFASFFLSLASLVFLASGLHAQHKVDLPASLADGDAKVEGVLEGLSFSEGPAFDPAGNLFFSENPGADTGRIWKVTPEGQATVFKHPARGANGLEFDNQGRLHIGMRDSVLRVETSGDVTVLAAKSASLSLGAINDLTVASDGALFFTNFNGNTVFYRDTAGVIKTRTFKGSNGVEWIEEKSILYLASEGLKKCQVDNATGEIGTCVAFAGNTDGLTVDEQGNVYRASWGDGQVVVHDSTGKQLGAITIDAKQVAGKRFTSGKAGNAANCQFGGQDRKYLYITGDGGCYRVRLKVAGRLRPGAPTSARRVLRPSRDKASHLRALRSSGRMLYFREAGAEATTADGRR